MVRKSNTASSATRRRSAPPASKETPRGGLMKRLSDDPRFVKAKGSWKALAIIGAKPST